MGISVIRVTCCNCGKNFDKSSSEIKRRPQQRHFCSRECYFKIRGPETVKCDFCGGVFKRSKYKQEQYKKTFCSRDCQKKEWERRKELTGKKVGRCIVVGPDNDSHYKETRWLLECACGERFGRRTIDIIKNRVYECPNCVFRRSQYYIGGKKYGRLSVQDKWEWRISPTNGKRFRHWFCVCECGNERWIAAHSIISGKTVSCGCWMQKNNSRYVNDTLYPTRHGKSGLHRDKTYCRWTALIAKCHNPKYVTYHNWGAEGYTVCDLWRNSYEAFHEWIINEGFNESLTVHLKGSCKEFSAMNCGLMDFDEHANIMKKKTYLKKFGIDYMGERKTLRQWADQYKMSYQTLHGRWRKCKKIEKCLEGEWRDGSGCHFTRHDVKDDDLIKLYEEGFSIVEIEERLGFSGVWNRLQRLGVKMRPRKRRDSVIMDRKIKEMLEEHRTFNDILNEVTHDKYSLSAKLKKFGIKIKKFEITY